MKNCIKCLVDKTTDNFREYKQGKYLNVCMECNRKQVNEWIENNKEKKN
jgi:tRNA U34 2-thiouridine synthase MnmA/TrmU